MWKYFLPLALQCCTLAAEEKPYLTGTLLGQLGNQLFEVAAASAIAWDSSAEAYFPEFAQVAHYPDGYYKHIFFRCKIEPPSKAVSQKVGVPPYGYSPVSFESGMQLQGYFQNEQYFAHHRERLIKLFAPHPKDLRYIQKKYAKVLSHPRTVSVHLRYYYAEKPDEDSFIQYDREYFTKAMALFPEDSLFVVTSDNIPFAKANIPCEGRNVLFIESEPYYIDFFLQSLCKHNIICNSTFSWWSAWLNQNPNKVVVRPKVWMGGYPDIGGPDSWIQIEAEGLQSRLKRLGKAP